MDDQLEDLLNEESFAPPSQSNPTGGKLKVGNREMTPDELTKAYLSLEKKFTQVSQKASRYKQFDEFEAYLNQNPQLRDKLNQEIKTYQSGGSSAPEQKAADAGKEDPVAKRLEEMEARWNRHMLEQEANGLRQKYNLDDETLNRVYRESADNGGISLEKALRIVRSDEMYAKNQETAQKEAAAKQEKAANADVGGSDTPAVAASPKDVSQLGESEFNSEVEKVLHNEFGITGE